MRKTYNQRFLKRASYIIYSIMAQQQHLTASHANKKNIVEQLGQIEYTVKQTEQEIVEDLQSVMKKLNIWISTNDLKVLI